MDQESEKTEKVRATKAAPAKRKPQAAKPKKETRKKAPKTTTAVTPVEEMNSDDKQLKSIFEQLGVDQMRSDQTGSMTPNGLLASVMLPDSSTSGRFTPTLQGMSHLFVDTALNQSSTSNSSSTRNFITSRDHPVMKRVRKDVAMGQKKGKVVAKEQQSAPTSALMEELLRGLKTKRAPETPKLVKQVFRNHASSEEEDEEDSDL